MRLGGLQSRGFRFRGPQGRHTATGRSAALDRAAAARRIAMAGPRPGR